MSNLTVSRGERVLFRDLSFGVAAGAATALTGPNGAGKTSLLRAVAGFLRPDAGRVTFAGVEAEDARTRLLHWLGHLDGLKSGRRVRDELAFQARWLGADDGGLAAAVEVLHLGPLMELEVRRLSAGQRRRLAFARLIAAPRPLWLLDEPLAPLDADWRAVFGRLMRAHLDRGGAVLAAVHDPLPVQAATLDLGAAR